MQENDVFQWYIKNSFYIVYPVTEVRLSYLSKNHGKIKCQAMYGNFFPVKTVYGMADAVMANQYTDHEKTVDFAKNYLKKYVPDQTFNVSRDKVNVFLEDGIPVSKFRLARNRVCISEVELYRKPSCALVIDKDTGFFEYYDMPWSSYVLPDLFNEGVREFLSNRRRAGVCQLPSGMAMDVAARAMVHCAQLAQKKRWFAKQAHNFISQQVAQYQK